MREIVGVQHIKAFIFDDTVLLTGANLSNTYFSNRQDRAWLIKDAPELASLLANALDTVAQFSYPLVPPRPQGGLDTEQVRGAAVRHGDQVEKAVEYAAEYALGQCHSGVDPVTQAWKFSRSLRQALTQVFMPCGYDHASTLHRKALPLNGLQQRLDGGFMGQSHAALGYAQDGSPGDEKKAVVDWSTADTWLFPMAQAGFAGVRQEEACTLRLLAHASRAGGKLYITTPYLNLGKPIFFASSNTFLNTLGIIMGLAVCNTKFLT